MFDIISSISSITKNVRLEQIVRCNSYRNCIISKDSFSYRYISKWRVDLG